MKATRTSLAALGQGKNVVQLPRPGFKEAPDVAACLPDALLVLDQRDAHMALAIFAKADAGRDRDIGLAAREGALRALRFAHAAGVRRFVLTSSAAAIAYGHPPGKTSYDEHDWTNPDAPGVQPYIKSKTIAERAARDWVAAEGGDMEYCAVCPVMVLGPVQGGDFAASVEPVLRLLNGSIPALPDVGFSIVDLRDIAELHVLALEGLGVTAVVRAAGGVADVADGRGTGVFVENLSGFGGAIKAERFGNGTELLEGIEDLLDAIVTWC